MSNTSSAEPSGGTAAARGAGKKSDPHHPQPKYTEYIAEAVGAACSRCCRQVFQLGTSKKKFGEVVRDHNLWRLVAGSLVCLDCLLEDVRRFVLGNRSGRPIVVEDETGRMYLLDVFIDARTMLAEYAEGSTPPPHIRLVNSQRRITIDARWLDHLLGRMG